MKLNASGLSRFLRDGNPSIQAGLVYGPDGGLARESVRMVQKSWQPQPEPFGDTVFGAGEVPETLIDDLNAYGFGGGERLVEVRNPDQTDMKTIVHVLAALEVQQEPSVAKLLVLAGELSPSSPLRKAFEKSKCAFACPCYADRDGDVARIVRETLQQAGHRMDPAAINLFVDNVPRDRSVLRNELDKMLLFLADQESALVTPEMVRTLICQDGETGFDNLAQFCADGDMAQADIALNRALEAGQHPAMLVRTLSRHFLRLAQVARARLRGDSVESAMSKLRPPVFIMQKQRFGSQSSKWDTNRLQKALSLILQTERDLKTSVSSPDSVLGRLVLQVCSLAR